MFVFDSTVGGLSSNSYIPVSYADDYFLGHFTGNEKWDSLDTTEKQRILVQSTRRLDMEKYGGEKTNPAQALHWPRAFIFHRDAYETNQSIFRDANTIPEEIKQATCEMALHYIKLRDGDFTYDDNDVEVISEIEIGPMKYSVRPNLKSDRLPSTVVRLLKALGTNGWYGPSMLRLER